MPDTTPSPVGREPRPTPPEAPGSRSAQDPVAEPVAESTDTERYSRQILFPGIGGRGQELLRRSHVAIVGCGATGAAAASLLARAGVGTLSVIDRDFVEPSNLQRQMLFDEEDARLALPKAEAARRKIGLFNSAATVLPHIVDLVPGNVHELLGPVDLVLDGTDNFETRYLLNDYAVEQGKPWIYAAAIGSYASTMNVLPRTAGPSAWEPTACLACLFPTPPAGPVETCDTAGILSTAANLAASLQATEALKWLTRQPGSMRRTLLSIDLWPSPEGAGLQRSEIRSGTPDPRCTVCGQRQFDHLAGSSRPQITLCGRNSVQIHEHQRPIDLQAFHERLTAHPDVQDLRSNDLLLRFRRGLQTITVFPDGRALIQGTTDPALARSLYARFIGS